MAVVKDLIFNWMWSLLSTCCSLFHGLIYWCFSNNHGIFYIPVNRKCNISTIENEVKILTRFSKVESGSSLAKLYNFGKVAINDIKTNNKLSITKN